MGFFVIIKDKNEDKFYRDSGWGEKNAADKFVNAREALKEAEKNLEENSFKLIAIEEKKEELA